MEIYVYGLVGLFAEHLLVIYLFNNMEPEKKCNHPDHIICEHCKPSFIGEPEKKDVWEDFDEKISFANKYISISDEGEMKLNEDKHFYYSEAYPESIWELDSDKIKDFIKTHFIPRAEVVEILKAMRKNTLSYIDGFTPDGVDRYNQALDNLLDLLTQEKEISS